MNILDENIIAPERQRLRAWRIHFRFVSIDVGRSGMEDRNELIPRLHTLRRPTFFTRDRDFYRLLLRHRGYCLVYLDVGADETAEFIRRFLRHRDFRTQAQRMGKIVRIRHSGITYWQLGQAVEHVVGW